MLLLPLKMSGLLSMEGPCRRQEQGSNEESLPTGGNSVGYFLTLGRVSVDFDF